MQKLAESEIKLLVNGKAGRGSAEKRAAEIRRAFPDIEAIVLQDIIKFSDQDWMDLLEATRYLCVLGGDGTAFSVLQKVHAMYAELRNISTVVALGSGGENVLAKAMRTIGDDIGVISGLFSGEVYEDTLFPQIVDIQLQENQDTSEIPSFWSIHGGFSAAVLYEIEVLRTAGKGDFYRRYLSSIRQLLKIRKNHPLFLQVNDDPKQAVLELGIISGQLPYWTSKVMLDAVASVPVLTTISHDSLTSRNESQFYARLLLEVLLLKLGVPVSNEIFQRTRLSDGDVLQVNDPVDQKIAIDSEIYQVESARVEVTTSQENSRILIARR